MDRISANESLLKNEQGIPVHIFANSSVPVEQTAVEELQTLLQTQDTLEAWSKNFAGDFANDPRILRMAITPDFHKGKGIPVGTVIETQGFVLPQAIGKDVNCGMRLLYCDLKEEQLRAKLPQIEKRIRHIFFQGGRNIPLSPNQKRALLQHGLEGLLETHKETKGKGLWKYYNAAQQEKDLQAVINRGSLHTEGIFSGLDNYIKQDYISYDSQIGSIGGGNHFVEVQKVKRVIDGSRAHLWGVKEGMLCIMIHTGSVSVGYPTAAHFVDILKEIYPKAMKHPKNGIFPLPQSETFKNVWREFGMSLNNAANFAFGNRLFLGLMIQQVLIEELGEFDCQLVYDSGHNMIFEEQRDGQQVFVHRKGACSARSAEQMQGTSFAWTGEPVLIPGSMGASSYLLAGNGLDRALNSSSHGAGRALSRGKSLKVDDRLLDQFLEEFKIINAIDPRQIRNRRDLMKKWREELKKEAPFAFKDIGAVIQTQEDAGMVNLVAELQPIFTIKS